MKNPKKLMKTVKKSAIHNITRAKNTKEPDAIMRISFYLAVSDMSPQAKKSWATLLPYMSKIQLERLANVLETEFLNAATKSIDDEFKKELKQVATTYVDSADDVPVRAPVLKRVRLSGENNAKTHLTPEQQVILLRVLKEYFQHRVRNIRIKQYSSVAKVIERLDKERVEELLRSIKS